MTGSGHLDFDSFAHRHPCSYVIIFDLADDLAAAQLGAIGKCGRKLIMHLVPAGDYATGLVRTSSTAQFHFRFSAPEDADRFASAMGCTFTEGLNDPATRCVSFDQRIYDRLRSVAEKPSSGQRTRAARAL